MPKDGGAGLEVVLAVEIRLSRCLGCKVRDEVTPDQDRDSLPYAVLVMPTTRWL